MKILQLCKKFPYPLTSGESIAVTYLSRALYKRGCEITLLAMNTTKHFVRIESLPKSFNHYQAVYTVPVDNRVKYFDALKNLFSNKSYHISRFISKEYELKLKEILEYNHFDIVQLESLYVCPYLDCIKKHTSARVVMRAHNVEYEIWERIRDQMPVGIKRWYLGRLTNQLKQYELSMLSQYDLLVPISDKDLSKFRKLGYNKQAKSIPIGLDLADYQFREAIPETIPSLSFIGGFDWQPNKEGVEWFLKQIWPSVRRDFPDIKLHLAGRGMPGSISGQQSEHLVIEEDVDDAKAFIAEHTAMIVPLLAGSGTRVKILEGLALGRIVITTTIGLEGIPARHDHELMIADDTDGFLHALSMLTTQPEKVKAMRSNAVSFIRQHYDHIQLADQLIESYSADQNEN